jgi:hypothetical protein
VPRPHTHVTPDAVSASPGSCSALGGTNSPLADKTVKQPNWRPRIRAEKSHPRILRSNRPEGPSPSVPPDRRPPPFAVCELVIPAHRGSRAATVRAPPVLLRPRCRARMTNSHTHTQPPRQKQLSYLRSLAVSRGETFVVPRSKTEASREIERLRGPRSSSRADRAAERFAARQIADRWAPATDVRPRRSKAMDRTVGGCIRRRTEQRKEGNLFRSRDSAVCALEAAALPRCG